MQHRKRWFTCAAVAMALSSRAAGADVLDHVIYHVKTPSVLETEKGTRLELPPGWFIDEVVWQERDLEMRRLQDQETRLGAENESLRKSADFPPWAAVALGAVGIALGVTAMILK